MFVSRFCQNAFFKTTKQQSTMEPLYVLSANSENGILDMLDVSLPICLIHVVIDFLQVTFADWLHFLLQIY